MDAGLLTLGCEGLWACGLAWTGYGASSSDAAMKIPTITGIIRRRLLLNYRVAPEVVQAVLEVMEQVVLMVLVV